MDKNTQKKFAFIVNIVYAAIILGILYLLVRSLGLFLPFVLAMALVFVLSPLVRFLYARLKFGKRAISFLLIALIYTGIAFLIVGIITQIVVAAQRLFVQLPDYYTDVIKPFLETLGSTVEDWTGRLSPTFREAFGSITEDLSGNLQSQVIAMSGRGISLITDLVKNIPGFAISLLFTILMSFYISVQYDKVLLFFKNHLRADITAKVTDIIGLLKGTVFKYIRAAFIIMFITFLELCAGLAILRLDNPVLLAAGIAIFDALPVFGTGGIVIPWVIIELLQQNFRLAGGLAILYIVVTLVRNIIEPRIVGAQLGLNPIVSLIAIYVGFRLFGVIGMICFPILTQILLTLYRNGYFSIFGIRKGTKEEKE